MTEKGEKVFKYQKKFNEAQEYLEKKYNREFSSELLSSLLGHYYENDNIHVFLINHKEIDSIDLKFILEKEFRSLIGSVEFCSNSLNFLISDRIEKARIKEKGLLWDIHKNDLDKQPSDPHAHCYSLNVKLHLGTGDLYRNNKIIDRLKKKEFQRLKEKIIKKGIDLKIN